MLCTYVCCAAFPTSMVKHSNFILLYQCKFPELDTPLVDHVGSHGAGLLRMALFRTGLYPNDLFTVLLFGMNVISSSMFGGYPICLVNPKYDVVLHVLHAHKGVPRVPRVPLRKELQPRLTVHPIPRSEFLPTMRNPKSPSVTKSWIDPIPKEGFQGSTENIGGKGFF